MSKTLNPAYAFLKIFQNALQVSAAENGRSISYIEGWTKTFKLNSQVEGLRVISDLNILYSQLENHIAKIDNDDLKSLQMITVQKIHEVIGIEYINQQWQYVLTKINVLLVELRYLANNLQGEWVDKEIEPKQLEEWRGSLIDIIRDMEGDSEINSEAKQIFVKMIKEIIMAIDLYILWGNEALSDKISKTGMFISAYEKKNGTIKKDKLKDVLVKMWNGLQIASCILQIAGFNGKDLFIGK